MDEKDRKTAKQEKLQKKPNPFVYYFVGFFFSLMIRLQFNLHTKGKKPKGPAIILSNHTSNHDYKFIASALWPRRVTFVATYHWFTFKTLGFWLRTMGAIPKYQFAPDMASMKKIRYVLDKNKGMVFIAPEGTVYGEGRLGFISPSIAKTIKIFGVPVYASHIEGAGLGNAKWSRRTHRGRVEVETTEIITKEETKTLTVSEIMERINSALSYDEFEFQKRTGVQVKGEDKAEDMDTMFYKCPCCNKEFTLHSKGNEIECSSCHTKATLNDSFRFKWSGDKEYFDNYSEWYRWQLEEVKKEVMKEDFKMEEEVEYGTDEEGIDNYVKVGKGTMTFSHSGWDYKGTFRGEEIAEHDDTENVFLATLKIGKHFELPFKNGHCRVFYPIKNGKTSMKWHLASRAMSELVEEKKAKI